jgi:hypothetical protein
MTELEHWHDRAVKAEADNERLRADLAVLRHKAPAFGEIERLRAEVERLRAARSDPLAPARGMIICFLIGVALWSVIIAAWTVLVR